MFVRPSLRGKNSTFDIILKLFNQFVCTCHAYRHHQRLPCDSTFTDFDLALGSQGQRRAKSIGFNLLLTFQLIMMKFGVALKHFKLNIIILFMSGI